MVTGVIFGWQPGLDGVRVAPFLTSRTRALLGAAGTARLGGLSYLGKPVEVVLVLPPAVPAGRIYEVRSVRLNRQPISGRITADRLLASGNRVEVRFGAARVASDTVTMVPPVSAGSHDDPRVFMPRTPSVTATRATGGVTLVIADSGRAAPLTYRVYRDGRRVADGISTLTWLDTAGGPATVTVCYSVVAVYVTTRLASQPSAPDCVRGSLAQTIAATDPRVSGAELVPPGDSVTVPTRRVGIGTRLVVAGVSIVSEGDYAIGADYDNHAYALNTGVTNAVKRLTVTGAAGDRRQAVLQMPHTRPVGGAHPIRPSTRAYVHLAPGTYTLELSDFFNMSAIAANARYTGPGGRAGPVNEARVAAITIDPLREE
jgi:hypothetical protein